MIAICMPGGDIEYIEADEMLWLRQAFDHEFKGMVMLRLAAPDRIYSVEAIDALEAKFRAAGASIARFTPPEDTRVMVVNTGKVREVEPSNPAISHGSANSVLKFGPRLGLAVRETEAQSEAILAKARQLPNGLSATAVASGAVLGAVIGAAAAVVITPTEEDA